MQKDVQTTAKLHSLHMLARSCSKSFKLGASTVRELKTSRYSSWFRKRRGTSDQMANIHWIIGKAREFQKHIYICFMDYSKALDCVDHNKLWKILQEMGIPDHLTCLLRNLYAGQEATDRTRHGTIDWIQIGKGVHQAVYCHLAYLTYMQSTSCEVPDWIKHKLESRLGEKYQ